MHILLLGEYSNVHATLAKGLRELGHEVTVVSNGDFWKNYPRDIDVSRRSGKIGGLMLMAKLLHILPKLTGYDVVQLINPMFLELRAERLFRVYDFLRKHNKKMVLGAFGMDYYWVHTCMTKRPLRYSDFNIGDELRTSPSAVKEQRDWLGTAKERLNRMIADDCDAIVTGLYEYDVCYRPLFKAKTKFIPMPIVLPESNDDGSNTTAELVGQRPLRLFVGISKNRSEYKGTDIMLRAAKAVEEKYPHLLKTRVAEGLPFSEYEKMLNGSDAIMDQLYSYTPGMNALLAMSKGIIVIGGGEPENYEIIGENELRPIINVEPTYGSVYHELETLVLNPQRIPRLKRESIEYVRRHHDYRKVARQYAEWYQSITRKP